MSTIETFDGTVHKVSDDHVGIVPKLDENVYHAHPALSSTQARELLDAPARYLFNREHPRVAKREFDVGSAAHSKVLGVGWPIAVIPANLLSADGGIRTAEAKQWVADARGRGEIPIKQVDADAVNLMAESILANQTARALLEMPGIPEASVFGVDPVTGIHTRCRFDYLGDERGGRRIALDVKSTAKKATKAAFARAVADLGYHVQDGHYEDTFTFAGEHLDEFLFIVVEKDAPHLTGVFKLDRDFMEIGRAKAAEARRVLAECREKDQWPGYGDGISLLRPPVYAIYDYQDSIEEGAAA